MSTKAPLKVLAVLGSLYLFLVGIGAMSASFKLLGRGSTEAILGAEGLTPFVALFAGILATTLVQSSSTSTSMVVGLVAGDVLPLETAVFMIMGANVGTTVTNTLVSLGHIARSEEYRRAFAAATVHDFFNILVLCVLFPLELYTGVLTRISLALAGAFQGVGGTKLADPIKIVTMPAIELLKAVVAGLGGGGVLLLVMALVLTFGMLVAMVKALKSLFVARLENLFDRLLFKTPYRGLVFGMALTFLVQSSSITTSIAVPLVGAGVLRIQQVFPYTMGANIGTTGTALLASLGALAAATPETRDASILALELAFFHVTFNVLGVALVWPFRALPIAVAEAFARVAVWNRLVPVVYIVCAFYLLPFLVLWLGR